MTPTMHFVVDCGPQLRRHANTSLRRAVGRQRRRITAARVGLRFCQDNGYLCEASVQLRDGRGWRANAAAERAEQAIDRCMRALGDQARHR